MTVWEQNSIQQPAIIGHERGRNGRVIATGNESESRIDRMRLRLHLAHVFRRVKLQVVCEIIDAPRHKIWFLDAEFCEFQRPSLVIELERFSVQLSARRRFRGWHDRSPNAGAFL